MAKKKIAKKKAVKNKVVKKKTRPKKKAVKKKTTPKKKSKAKRRISRLEQTAYHEAGHAVACIEMSIALKDVTIVPAEDYLGCANVIIPESQRPASLRDRFFTEDRKDLSEEKRCIYSLAGRATEAILTKRRDWMKYCACGSDYTDAYVLAMSFYDEPKIVIPYLKFLIIRTKYLLKRPRVWKSIECLTRELLEKKTLSGRAAERIIRDSWESDFQDIEDARKSQIKR